MGSVSVPRVSDKELVKFFIDNILLKHEDYGLSDEATCLVQLSGLQVTVDVRGASNHKDLIDSIRKGHQLSTTISDIYLSDQSMNGSSVIYRRSKESFIDSLEVTENSYKVSDTAYYIYRNLNALILEHAAPTFSANSDNALEIASAHHEVLKRLEGMSAELIEKQVKQVQDLERDKQKFLDDRGADFAEKVNAQDDAYSKKVSELEAEYNQRRQELDERQKKIDDADNTSTRRKTTTRTLDEAQIKARGFNFSANVTERSNKAVKFAMALVAIGVVGLVLSLYELWSMHNIELKNQATLISAMIEGKIKENATIATPTSQFTYFLYFRILASSALAISSIVYLIRWHNSWADRIAQQELDNQIFIRDLNRAQLAVEMSLEWNEKKDGDIPPRLLEALTEGLFKPKDTPSKELLHPAEQIAAALVKTADKVTLPLGGSTLETTGKKLRKANPISSVPEQKVG